MPTGHTEPLGPDALLALARGRTDPGGCTPRAAEGANAAEAEPAPASGAASSAAGPLADTPVCPTADRTTDPTRIVFTAEGPALVPGPVELVAADGTVLRSDRFLVALCQCKRSRTYPLCDTSHRRRPRGGRI